MSAFYELFGEYEPIITESGAMTDWGYIAQITVFCIVLVSVLRLIRSLWK